MAPPTYQIGSWLVGGDGGITDAANIIWRVNPQGTTGIFDSADNRLNQTVFNEYDGAQRSRNYDNALPITIAGTAQGVDFASVAAARRAFVGMLAGGGQKTLTVTDVDGAVLTITVEKNGKQQVTPQSQGCDFDWQLNCIAADPRKYLPDQSASIGLPSSSGGLNWSSGGGLNWSSGGGLDWGIAGSNGLIQLTNTGTAEAWPEFQFFAPTDGSTLVNPTAVNQLTGETLKFVDTLIQGDIVDIKSSIYERSVTKNGVPYRRNLQVAQWFSIAPGETMTVQFQGTGTSSTSLMTATLSPAVYA
jgi:hypothetical protein